MKHPAESDANSKLHLKVGPASDGRLLAIAYTVDGEDLVMLDVEVVASEEEAREWFKRVEIERPWIERS